EDLFGLDGRFGDKGFADHTVVRIGVVGRDVAFVAEEKLHLVEGKLRAERFREKNGMEGLWGGAPGHGDAKDASLADGLLRGVYEDSGGVLGDGGDVGKELNGAIQENFS